MSSSPSFQASCFYSRLLPDLFSQKHLDEQTAIRVLDFGPAKGDTIKFLSQFNCHLQVIDIVGELKSIDRQIDTDDDVEDEVILNGLRRALSLDGEEPYDICLFWDSLNYQNARVLSLFTKALIPHLKANFLAHGFAVLNKSTVLREQNYGIINNELLAVSDQSRAELPYRHSQATIKDAMPGIAVKQSILREDGRLEMILNRSATSL